MSIFPVFLKLAGRRVLVVGGGPVAAGKLRALLDADADVTVVAPEIVDAIAAAPVRIERRRFQESDVDGIWYVVAAAPPDVNRAVAAAAHAKGIFVNAVDDIENASAYAGAVLRRAGVTVALSSDGEAPALVGLMREALEELLPEELESWMAIAREERQRWLEERIPMEQRRPRLLEALVKLYERRTLSSGEKAVVTSQRPERERGLAGRWGGAPRQTE
jgi:siroheme synthase-like protein